MPKVSQQYRDERREHILQAARQCFLRDGFHATSMQDLFAAAGLSSGAVYRYFASKDEMILAIAEENMREVLATIHTAATQQAGRSVGDVLADVIDTVQAKHADDGLTGLAMQVWAEASRNPSLAEHFGTLLADTRADLARVVRRAQKAGGLPKNVPADVLATVLISIVPGYLLQLGLYGPQTVDGMADAIRALWPNPASG